MYGGFLFLLCNNLFLLCNLSKYRQVPLKLLSKPQQKVVLGHKVYLNLLFLLS